jgi:D-lactate dehydrogenase (cytochrome)
MRSAYVQLSAQSSRIPRALRAAAARNGQCLSAQRRCASTEKKGSSSKDEPDDFRAQLYASTFARVQKEKEEQAKYSAMREARRQPSTGMAFAALLLGVHLS